MIKINNLLILQLNQTFIRIICKLGMAIDPQQHKPVDLKEGHQ